MTNTHGGPRPNSGRPPKHGVPGVSTTVRLPPDVRDFLSDYGGTITAGVMSLVMRSKEWKAWRKSREP